ncbi:MAG: sigma-70 family RNA polymerase sigma factor, partial [Clostridia bacterium]|nr:sigma-70 family RNA polymerase sigma factor [Clostridia bacterium]
TYNSGKRVWSWKRLPPALTAQEELRLLRQYREYGDRDVNVEDPAIRERFCATDDEVMPLREVLIYGNLRLVAKYVRNVKLIYQNSVSSIYPNMDDMLSEGVMALMRAIDNFDPEYNFKFSTYLQKSIVGRLSKLKYQYRKIEGKQKAFLKNPPLVSLNEPVSTSHHGDAEEGDARIDLVADKSFSWESVDGKLNEEFIRTNVLPYLPRKERIIFESVYLDGMSYEDVAATLNIKRQRVEQIINNAVNVANVRRIYEEGPNEVDKIIKGVNLSKKQIAKLVSCQEIITKYGREFLVEKVYPRLTPSQQDLFDGALYNYFGQSERDLELDTGKRIQAKENERVLRKVVETAEKILLEEKKGKTVKEAKIPENIRQKVNRVERLLEKYGGKVFLDNYFLKTLPENERRAFYYGMLTYRGQNMSFLAQKAGLSMKQFKTCLESATAKLKTTNFDNIVWLCDMSWKDLNIVNDQENVFARKQIVDELGIKRLIKHFKPRLNETQKIVFENLYL